MRSLPNHGLWAERLVVELIDHVIQFSIVLRLVDSRRCGVASPERSEIHIPIYEDKRPFGDDSTTNLGAFLGLYCYCTSTVG